MKEQTGETYQSSTLAKSMFVAESKVGKSAAIIANALGVFPSQKNGGIVDSPENLHVITFDANALGGIQRFLTETCKAPPEALKFRVYNLQEDLRKVSTSQLENDYTLYNTIHQALSKIADRVRGVPVLHISSLTGVAAGLHRALAGPAGKKKGGGMDQSKWTDYGMQLNELRNWCQQDLWHCLWEAHVMRMASNGQNKDDEPKESLQLYGSAGQGFAFNVEQVFRLRRQFGQKFEGTNCDKVVFDTRPNMNCVANGRGFTEALAPQEPDLAAAFQKLGLKVGGWGAKSAKPSVVKAVK